MAKVYAEQVKKAQFLAAGLKSNYELINSRLGITMEQIQAFILFLLCGIVNSNFTY